MAAVSGATPSIVAPRGLKKLTPFHSASLDFRTLHRQIVPIAASALLSSKIIKNAKLVVYKGAPHGMCTTLKDRVNEELLGFIKS